MWHAYVRGDAVFRRALCALPIRNLLRCNRQGHLNHPTLHLRHKWCRESPQCVKNKASKNNLGTRGNAEVPFYAQTYDCLGNT
jgi:hypothetical protein